MTLVSKADKDSRYKIDKRNRRRLHVIDLRKQTTNEAIAVQVSSDRNKH